MMILNVQERQNAHHGETEEIQSGTEKKNTNAKDLAPDRTQLRVCFESSLSEIARQD
jgi:hypothetical protein